MYLTVYFLMLSVCEVACTIVYATSDLASTLWLGEAFESNSKVSRIMIRFKCVSILLNVSRFSIMTQFRSIIPSTD